MSDDITAYDHGEYRRFVGPAILDKELNFLIGIIEGIEIDQIINDKELSFLTNWLDNTFLNSSKHFAELLEMVKISIDDKLLTDEEKKNILWLCQQNKFDKPYYNIATALMQNLHGILAGIAADELIEEKELIELGNWIDNHKELSGCWPFDEIEALIISVLSDHKIDEHEHKALLAFCSEFLRETSSPLLLEGDFTKELLFDGVCAVDPVINFKENCFCCTGESEKATRKEIVNVIESLGGRFSKNVTQNMNYLIVGAAGNKAWAFSCYGRKVEEVMNLRKKGFKIQLIHEFDFWDAVEDCKAQ